MDAFKLTVSEASRLIQLNELTPIELLESVLQRIDKLEPKLKAWVNIDRESAMTAAERYTDDIAEGRLKGPLHGIPIGVKDIYFTAGMKTSAGSKIYNNFVPHYDATTITRLRDSGAIILGKTETTEFAYTDPAPTRNPWNTGHTPGGSSSGSAAAVSAYMCPTALGSQTGGSTIRPAAYCGIVGLKPTYGRISRYGIFPLSWSLDHVGILTRTVEDAAIILEVIAGYDSKDFTSSSELVPHYRQVIDGHPLRPPRLGLLKEFFYENAQGEIRRNFEDVSNRLAHAGAEVVEIRLPESFRAAHAAHRIILMAEAAAIHIETFINRMRDYRPNMHSLVATGTLIPASTYIRAQRIRGTFIREIAHLMKYIDFLITPATTTPALKGLDSTGDPAFNSPWSFCGFPAITVPSGLTKGGLPLGIQLTGLAFDEERLLGAARWCEKTIRFEHTPKFIC